MRFLLLAGLLVAQIAPASAASVDLKTTAITEWKAVYGRVEARDSVPARARTGGDLVDLAVSEGDMVRAGQVIAVVRDEKLAFQLAAIDAQTLALQSQLDNATAELARAQALIDSGATTTQRLDQLRTQAEVLRNQLAAARAERGVILQREQEGKVLAPTDGLVLDVPVTRGAVVMPGEAIATIGGGGVFLRLAVPERHATLLRAGAAIEIETAQGVRSGRLAKIYPQIEAGRVLADVEVEGLDKAFVGARILVRLPVGMREALLVPAAALVTRHGLDFVTVANGTASVDRVVVAGERLTVDGRAMVEVLTGLVAGDRVVVP